MAEPGTDEPSSRTGSPDGEGQVSGERLLLHQRLAVRELIDTELSYLHVLRLCASDIRSSLQQLPQRDLDVLFSNIDDVIEVNSRFLHDLQETASRKEEQVHLIGNLFLECHEELERVYKVYCASYDQALLLLDTYRREPELQREIQSIIEAVLPQAGPSGLSFLLVIPLQRITKYPLLLQKILENTVPDASAYPVLQRAVSALQDVNTNINEYKRRKEVASKYTKVEQLTLRERLARLNTHTLSKKTTRLSQLLKQEAGLVPRTEDKEFDDLEERFHCVSLCVTEMKNNVAVYLDNLEAFLCFRPQEYDLDIPGGPVVQYCSLMRDLQLQAFPYFKQRLKGLVWQPLCSLAKALAGPQNLIKKRLDKLLDFERVEEKLLEVGSVTYEEQEARHTYQALNSLLVAELPQLNQLAMRWLGQILCTFMGLQRELAQQVLQRAEGSLAQLPHYHLSEPAFRKLVEDALGQTGHQLRSFQENFEKVLPPPTVQVVAVYPFVARSSHEVSLQAGQLVTVLEAQDKKGNPEWSLVEVNEQRGYVPSSFLARAASPAPWGWGLPS
ncbi:rho guanine nucleotide exchange factor 37 isoform X3 [Neomonachus schauinslandi]|uniref:Rho guanine nucleotide exchange factor 37 n=1 Tax=Neomonachus schauinslandi TaxID=29088 RepID=A0A8M1MKB8_NEOSC|nr:rho guanine nucleotide exchange factor 37 isoform X3 [Neomonachus schauinslandi]XP_044773088.1 rho guanine nucleotide exchange factor 37 isoform X3 [Neomonachus schauinslandi]